MPVQAQVLMVCAVPAAVILVSLWLVFRRRETPEARERRRRQTLHATGRIGEAVVTGAGENEIYYEYTIRGVQYSTAQDISALRGQLPADLGLLAGAAGMKYLPGNPVQSIVVCEEWSGLRVPGRVMELNPLADIDAVGHQPQDAALGERPVEQRVKRQAAG